MDKTIYDNAVKLITNLCQGAENLDSLCHFYGITKKELVEVVDDLSLIGFKEKYKQHNHAENNK